MSDPGATLIAIGLEILLWLGIGLLLFSWRRKAIRPVLAGALVALVIVTLLHIALR